MEESKVLTEEMEIGAKIIGKTVIEATKICNLITENGGEDSKELVNLVLSRCEVLKAEILAICRCEVNFDQKLSMMESEQTAAVDYFNSILAQIS
ncbi:MAG: hypothetical protein J6A78_01295 [Clostridia bacterium]|nr:hypothetical protein [Clostridia bacterium]